MSIAEWYRSTWGRSRRMQQTPYLATPDTSIARAATALHTQAQAATDLLNQNKEKKPQESLFGPNIGVVSSGPAWTAATEKKVLSDELTPEIVAGWIEKSKDPSQPTTTLQALVNLKRPTIRLSPLLSDDTTPTGTDPQHYNHGLEFEYDCDAPKCGIYVHVHLPKDHPDAPTTAASSSYSKLLIFETVVSGGFGKLLKLDDGAVLELGRFEYLPSDLNNSATTAPLASGENVEAGPTGDAAIPQPSTRSNRRRFTHFHFRRRSQGQSVSGPALAVVDAEPPTTATTNDSAKTKDDGIEGVKVTIRLAALDEQGTELASPNEQITYLHVVRFGTHNETELEEDTRPWVVKVVKREATIGPHTFHLHEIYGLTSSSTAHTHAPIAALPADEDGHTYPPGTTAAAPPTVTEEDPSSECLLCLSNPREVVLLPCRHLVACKDCALNMVEFGAGGNITHADESAPAPAGDSGAAPVSDIPADQSATVAHPVASTSAAPPSTPASIPARRKRRAKGWFCPVCRQPYTSLLRITTTPPSPMSIPGTGEDHKEDNSEDQTAEAGTTRGALTSSFLRTLTLTGRATVPDIENQAGGTRTGT